MARSERGGGGTIVVELDPRTAAVVGSVEGVSGPSCSGLTEALESALGAVSGSERTADYRREDDVLERQAERG